MEVLQRTANRGSISTATLYDIDNSCKFESDNTESLTKSQTSSNRKTWTLSFWFKRTNTDFQYLYHYNVSSGNEFYIMLNGETDWRVEEYNSGRKLAFHSTVPLRDTSAWYHLVIACDTTQSTSTDRFKIYLNGVQVNSISGYFSTAQYPTQNYDTHINNSSATISIGKSITASTNFKGYLAEVNFIDGLMKDEEDFGKFDSTTGIWQPIKYTGSYGSQGYYLTFETAGDMGDDKSGNGLDFTENNLTAVDQATDTPTNNFCTMNMLDRTNGNSKNQEGATKVTTDGGSDWCSMVATMGVTKGKWYWEAQRSGGSSDSNDVIVGIVGDADPYIPYSSAAQYYIGNVAESSSIGFGTTLVPNVRNGSGDSVSNSAGDIIMIGLDMDNGKIYFGVNGTWDGLGTGGSTLWSSFDNQFVLPAVAVYQGKQIKINFGGYASYTISSAQSDANGYGTFEYAVPSGYYSLCTKNLAEYG